MKLQVQNPSVMPERNPESVNEYEDDDFEKEDLVQMAEPKPARNPSIGSKNNKQPSTI